jgi:hypothetical protein
MSNISSLFIAFGKRFTVDCKVYGGRNVCNGRPTSYTYESEYFTKATLIDVINDIVPGVCGVLMLSSNPKDREAAVRLMHSWAVASDYRGQTYDEETLRKLLLADLLQTAVMVNGILTT